MHARDGMMSSRLEIVCPYLVIIIVCFFLERVLILIITEVEYTVILGVQYLKVMIYCYPYGLLIISPYLCSSLLYD